MTVQKRICRNKYLAITTGWKELTTYTWQEYFQNTFLYHTGSKVITESGVLCFHMSIPESTLRSKIMSPSMCASDVIKLKITSPVNARKKWPTKSAQDVHPQRIPGGIANRTLGFKCSKTAGLWDLNVPKRRKKNESKRTDRKREVHIQPNLSSSTQNTDHRKLEPGQGHSRNYSYMHALCPHGWHRTAGKPRHLDKQTIKSKQTTKCRPPTKPAITQQKIQETEEEKAHDKEMQE